MALRLAVNSGSWSDPTIWNAGALPEPGDIICANGFNVVIDQNVNVGTITTAAQTALSETAAMTSNIAPSGIASSNDEGYSSFAWQAFQSPAIGGAIGARWISFNMPTVSNPIWLAYEFPTPKIISIYSITEDVTTSIYHPKNWTFEGWNGSSWVILDTRTNVTYSSTTTYFNFTNTTAYIKYRINITAAQGGNNVQIYEFRMFTALSSLSNGAAGGGFTISGSRNVTCTNSSGVVAGTTTCLTFNGSSPISAVVNANVFSGANPAAGLVHSGTGTLTVNGNVYSSTQNNSSNNGCLFTGTGVFNIAGNLINVTSGGWVMRTSGFGSTLNIVGNLYTNTTGNNTGVLLVTNNNTVNITGNLIARMDVNTGWTTFVIQANTPCTINLTGNIITGLANTVPINYGITSNSSINLYITGDLNADRFENGTPSLYGSSCVNLTGVCYFNHIGAVRAANRPSSSPFISYTSTNTSAINILTGPFISGEYGITPFQVFRMHLRPTANSYFEFRDNSTNGALPPGATGSRTYLYSPSTVISAPNQNDVRFGTVYASGSQTGQMRVPLPSQVSLGIPVDNTVGTAVLTGPDLANTVWNKLVSELTSSNSIGVRLKNVSTPDITANQIIGLK